MSEIEDVVSKLMALKESIADVRTESQGANEDVKAIQTEVSGMGFENVAATVGAVVSLLEEFDTELEGVGTSLEEKITAVQALSGS